MKKYLSLLSVVTLLAANGMSVFADELTETVPVDEVVLSTSSETTEESVDKSTDTAVEAIEKKNTEASLFNLSTLDESIDKSAASLDNALSETGTEDSAEGEIVSDEEPVEPIEPVSEEPTPTKPLDPTPPSEPVDPNQPIAPVNPIDAEEPKEPLQPLDPTPYKEPFRSDEPIIDVPVSRQFIEPKVSSSILTPKSITVSSNVKQAAVATPIATKSPETPSHGLTELPQTGGVESASMSVLGLFTLVGTVVFTMKKRKG